LLLIWPYTVGERHAVTQLGTTVKAITAIHSAENEYFSEYGHWGRLEDLGRNGAGILSNDIANGRSGPYDIALEISKEGYQVRAIPRNSQCRGCRSFYSDQSLTIRMSRGSEMASSSSAMLGASR
jgi:hypothetical protein